MKWTIELAQPQLQAGRVAVVTGANTGLGFETAKVLAGLQMTVILACRNAQKADEAKAKILKDIPDAALDFIALDLNALSSVKAFADAFSSQYQRLDLLINNAGLMMPPYSKTSDGFESQMGANYLGHFALTGHLLEVINQTPDARIVTLSSMAHRWGTIQFDDLHFEKKYIRKVAYGQSKLACLMFAYELQRRLQASGSKTISVAAHPGIAVTDLGRYFPQFLSPFMRFFFQSAYAGAQPTLYAALGDDIQGGDYCGPDGKGERRGAATKVGSSKLSRDVAVAERLWRLSEDLVKVTYLS